MGNMNNFSMTLRRFKTCLQHYKKSRPLLDLGEMLNWLPFRCRIAPAIWTDALHFF